MIHSLRSRRALLSGRRMLLVTADRLAAIAGARAVNRSGQPDPARGTRSDDACSWRRQCAATCSRARTRRHVQPTMARSSLPAFAGAFRIRSRSSATRASMVEAVSAEEIGKLPDVSIAESIARLPGIAAQRVAGRAEIVSIRGFSPDFTTVLLNGRQQASSGFNRAVEFDQYPSELMASVVVYKTPDASISGMGLAGTVDLRTIRPLEYGKRAIAVNLRGQFDEGGGRNEDFSKYGWRGSASYIDQNESGTLGWMMSYAHLDAPSHTDHTKNWFYGDYGDGVQTLIGRRNPRHQHARYSRRRNRQCGMEAERRRPFRPRPLLFAVQAEDDDARRRVVLLRLDRRRDLHRSCRRKRATASCSTLRTTSPMSFRYFGGTKTIASTISSRPA